MTALTGMKLSTTLLADLPGNKMSSAGAAKQGFQYRKCLQIKVRRTAPSEHFIKASDKESSSDESSSSEDEEDLSTSRTTANPYNVTSPTSNFKPFKITIPSTITPSRNINQTNQESTTSEDSSSAESSVDESDADTTRNRSIPPTVRYHAWSESQERRLLDHLIDYDDDEDNRVNGIQTDDDFYLMWKCGGESRRTSKGGAETMVANKRVKTSKMSSRSKNLPFNQQLTKKESKSEVFCGWETVYSKKPIQKLREERKQRLSQPNTSSFYASKYSTTTDRGHNSSPRFMFFHYTDIARYIQQYRSNHTCENPCSNYPACNHEMTSMQAIRDVSFPFKFDLATNSIKQKIVSRGVQNNARGAGFEPTPIEEQMAMRTGNPTSAGYLSPVSFRPPYSLKPPTADNWNYLPESSSRLKYQLKKIWRSYEQKSTSSQTEPKNDDVMTYPQRPLSEISQADDVNISSINGNKKFDVTEDIRNNGFQQRGKVIGDVIEKQNTISHLRELKLEENCLQVKEEMMVNRCHQDSGSILGYDDTNGFVGMERLDDARTCYELEKNLRMRNLLVAEINSLQKKQIISVEQKRKLDKFKEALNAMASGALDHKATLPPSGSATKRFISGSVRAYYTRTTNSRLIDSFRTDLVRCGPDLDSNPKSDDKPIILVSQPHLRHLADKPKKPEPPLLGKKLIGGRAVERIAKHPADAKQFTRITDLLRIKERQQSGRRALSGSTRRSPLGSGTRKRPPPYGECQKQKTSDNLPENMHENFNRK